ncbi:hypothetical protein NUSPORA_01353 [Nucleospora cyclopteri]
MARRITIESSDMDVNNGPLKQDSEFNEKSVKIKNKKSNQLPILKLIKKRMKITIKKDENVDVSFKTKKEQNTNILKYVKLNHFIGAVSKTDEYIFVSTQNSMEVEDICKFEEGITFILVLNKDLKIVAEEKFVIGSAKKIISFRQDNDYFLWILHGNGKLVKYKFERNELNSIEVIEQENIIDFDKRDKFVVFTDGFQIFLTTNEGVKKSLYCREFIAEVRFLGENFIDCLTRTGKLYKMNKEMEIVFEQNIKLGFSLVCGVKDEIGFLLDKTGKEIVSICPRNMPMNLSEKLLILTCENALYLNFYKNNLIRKKKIVQFDAKQTNIPLFTLSSSYTLDDFAIFNSNGFIFTFKLK